MTNHDDGQQRRPVHPVGNISDLKPPLILDRKAPKTAAERLVADSFMAGGFRVLQHYREAFYF